jgi:hypothetical protein
MNRKFTMGCFVIASLAISLNLGGCYSSSQTTPEPTAITPANSSGLEKPGSFGIVPVTTRGFSVYGNARVTANSKEVRAEIDCLDVEKIKLGFPAVVLNMQKEINASGKVTRLPENAADSDTCMIDLELDDPRNDTSPTETPSSDPAVSNGAVMKSSISMRQSLPSVDSDVEVRIKLPVEDSLPYVDNQSLYQGKDGKMYVWYSEKDVTGVTVEDLTLVEVLPGATDGRVTKILKGLPARGSVLIGF